jgi:hypothetical protein
VFADKLGYSEDELFRFTEAFGGGMGGTQGVCGAVSAMVLVAGAIKSFGIDKLTETNKKESYNSGGHGHSTGNGGRSFSGGGGSAGGSSGGGFR